MQILMAEMIQSWIVHNPRNADMGPIKPRQKKGLYIWCEILQFLHRIYNSEYELQRAKCNGEKRFRNEIIISDVSLAILI